MTAARRHGTDGNGRDDDRRSSRCIRSRVKAEVHAHARVTCQSHEFVPLNDGPAEKHRSSRCRQKCVTDRRRAQTSDVSTRRCALSDQQNKPSNLKLASAFFFSWTSSQAALLHMDGAVKTQEDMMYS